MFIIQFQLSSFCTFESLKLYTNSIHSLAKSVACNFKLFWSIDFKLFVTRFRTARIQIEKITIAIMISIKVNAYFFFIKKNLINNYLTYKKTDIKINIVNILFTRNRNHSTNIRIYSKTIFFCIIYQYINFSKTI